MGAALCFLALLQMCKGLPLMEDADRLPIAEDEVDDLGRCRQQPGEGVQQVQRRDRVEMRKDRVDPDHAEHTGPRITMTVGPMVLPSPREAAIVQSIKAEMQ